MRPETKKELACQHPETGPEQRRANKGKGPTEAGVGMCGGARKSPQGLHLCDGS